MITCILFIGCSKQQILSGNSKESINLQNEEFTNESNRENENKMQMNVKVGDRNFIATLKDNEAVDVLVEMLKGTVSFDGREGFTVTARIPIRWGETYD